MTMVAIMQPTYLPWIGYFAMIDRVDKFIFLDSVQFARRSWQQRNRIKLDGREFMLTVPVLAKGRRDQTITDVEIDPAAAFAHQHVATIRQAYAKAPFFAEYADDLVAIFTCGHGSLSELNIALISWLMSVFGISTPVARSSWFKAQGHKADLLANICREIGADTYLSAPASAQYIEDSNAFAELDIAVLFHTYDHPVYAQGREPFLPYMSAIDLLFHAGPQSLSILRSGVHV
jgi:hypothetical protein